MLITSHYSDFEIIVSLLSLFLCSLPLVFARSIGRFFFTLHIVFSILFFVALHLSRLLAGSHLHIYGSPLIYIQSHLVVITYIWGFFLLTFTFRKHIPSDQQVISLILSIPDKWIVVTFSFWILFKLYLVESYGLYALGPYRSLLGATALTQQSLPWRDFALQQYSMSFAAGAAVIYVTKVALVKNYWQKAPITISFWVCMIPYLFLLEPSIGSRRFALSLGLVVLLLDWASNHELLKTNLREKIVRVALVSLVIFFVSAYYQNIRSNYFRPDISSKLLSESRTDILHGLYLSFLPGGGYSFLADDSRILSLDSESQRHIPFELIYDVLDRVSNGTEPTKGEILLGSFATAVPRVIANNNKTVINADDIIATKFNLVPHEPHLVIDLPTSISAICLAELGPLGAFISPLIAFMAFIALFKFSRFGIISYSPFFVFLLGKIFFLAAGAESDLTTIIVTLRDVCILALILFVVGQVRPIRNLMHSA